MKKILIVEDEIELADATKALLESEGYAVITAHDGAEGYQAARREKPDLVLLDVMMAHDSEGIEVARQLNEDPETRRIPVILLTGIRKVKNLPFTFEPDEDWLPVKAVVEKPAKPERLLRTVRQALKG